MPTKKKTVSVLSSLFAAVVVLVFAVSFWKQWKTGVLENLDFSAFGFFASSLGMVGFVLWIGVLWRWLIDTFSGKRLPWSVVIYIQIMSWMGRYLPGKIGLVIGKMLLGMRYSISKSALLGSTLYEQAYLISSGISVVLISLGIEQIHRISPVYLSQALAYILVIVILLGIPASIRLFLFWFGGTKKISAGVEQITIPYWRSVALFIWYHLCHLIAGVGFYFLIKSLVPNMDIGVLTAIGIITAAHVAGILAIFAPAGIGVREAVLVVLLAPSLGLDLSYAMAIIVRLWSTAADGILFFVLLLGTPFSRAMKARDLKT